MLLREQRGRHEYRHLLAGLDGDERGAQRHFGLAEADIAADHPVHGLAGLQIREYLLDRRGLIGRLFEAKARLKGAIVGLRRLHGSALAGGPPRIQIQQLRGHVADALRRFAARLLPLIAAELMERRGLGRRTGIAR